MIRRKRIIIINWHTKYKQNPLENFRLQHARIILQYHHLALNFHKESPIFQSKGLHADV